MEEQELAAEEELLCNFWYLSCVDELEVFCELLAMQFFVVIVTCPPAEGEM